MCGQLNLLSGMVGETASLLNVCAAIRVLLIDHIHGQWMAEKLSAL